MIVCVLLVVYYFLLFIIVCYYQCFLCICVKLFDVSVNEVFGVVISGEVDFGVSFIGSQEVEIEFKVLFQEWFVVVCCCDYLFVCKKCVIWNEFYVYDYVLVDKMFGNCLLFDQVLVVVVLCMLSVCEMCYVMILFGLIEVGFGVVVVLLMVMLGYDYFVIMSVLFVELVVKWCVGIVKWCGCVLMFVVEVFYWMVVDVKCGSFVDSGILV